MQNTIIEIESLDMEARGIAHLKNEDGSAGKVIFVEGALPGERVEFQPLKKKKNWEVAAVTKIHRESALRVTPRCAHYGVCGGCAMQHLEAGAQVAVKQRVLEDNLKHIGKIKPENVISPIYGPSWGYRYRARLSVRYVRKKETVLVGFREKKSPFVADMTHCEVLPPHVCAMLLPLRELIASLSITEQIPQIELAVSEADTVMVLRIMAPLSNEDEVKLKRFADTYRVQWWLQTKGPDTAMPWYPASAKLHYSLPEFGITMPFKPTDFTQVNPQINRVLVDKALRLLAPGENERIADLFCGLGNFTLPIASRAREVLGIEGSIALTQRAQENAVLNGLEDKTAFKVRNLFEMSAEELQALGIFHKMLIDPPRDGAFALCQSLAAVTESESYQKPSRIVYVSCNPATLARDAGVLVNEAGYVLRASGVVNMFPHTAHVESISVFERVGS